MTDILQRDIVLVPFPFTDFETTKKRPVLVVSNNDINRKQLDFIGLAITSKIRRGPYSVQAKDSDLEAGSFPKQSEIRCDKIATIKKKLIIKKLCKLNNTVFSFVNDQLSSVFK